uniref:Uncharacterized protein n=1 Tax=Odontella aurita TaxID=265563 RepID=A0A7S4NHF9_9STRA
MLRSAPSTDAPTAPTALSPPPGGSASKQEAPRSGVSGTETTDRAGGATKGSPSDSFDNEGASSGPLGSTVAPRAPTASGTGAARGASALTRGAIKVEGVDARYGRRGGPRRIPGAPAPPPPPERVESEPIRVEAELVVEEDDEGDEGEERDGLGILEAGVRGGRTTTGTATIVESEASVRWLASILWGSARPSPEASSAPRAEAQAMGKRGCGLVSVDCRNNRMHLGLCLCILLGAVAALAAGLGVLLSQPGLK